MKKTKWLFLSILLFLALSPSLALALPWLLVPAAEGLSPGKRRSKMCSNP
jgi:hypothetical protein